MAIVSGVVKRRPVACLVASTLRNSPAWTLHVANFSDVHIHNLNISNPANAPNSDGMDLDCSRNGLVEDCVLSVGDDVLCVKSGIDFLGRTYGVRSENITFRNIVAGEGHGLTIGSETAAGVRNVSFM